MRCLYIEGIPANNFSVDIVLQIALFSSEYIYNTIFINT